MTTFQKLLLCIIVLLGLSSLFLFNQSLNRQEQIRKEDLTAKEQQRQIANCKYLLNNKNLFSKDNVNLLENYQLAFKGGKEEIAQKLLGQYKKQSDEYHNSESNCLDLLRRLGQEE